jgi:hypothetical protein
MHRTKYAASISVILDLLASLGGLAPAPGSEAGTGRRAGRPRETLTEGETRVLRFLPTHLFASGSPASLVCR